MKATNTIRQTMLSYLPITMFSVRAPARIHPKFWVEATGDNTNYGSNRKARSSFKQNKRLQMKSGNFKSRY